LKLSDPPLANGDSEGGAVSGIPDQRPVDYEVRPCPPRRHHHPLRIFQRRGHRFLDQDPYARPCDSLHPLSMIGDRSAADDHMGLASI
jgi:hypothetical protein